MSVVGHLGKKWRPLGEGSLTVMTVMQDGPSWYDGPSQVSVEGHLKKKWRPLGEGSLTDMTVMQDGPSWVQRSVSCIRWGTLGEKNERPLETGSLSSMTVVQDRMS